MGRKKFNKKEFQQLNDAIYKRFPNANFIICCFKTIDEIENKILTSEYDTILYSDQYIQGDKLLYDAFLIKRKENCNAIYYKDVIDVLIENNFIRNDCDHKFMENILKHDSRNNNSLPWYSTWWGS